MGCLAGDLNEDGGADLVVYYWGRTPVAFLTTTPSSRPPRYRPVEIVAERERWFSNAAMFADLDGDGHADLLIGNYYPDGSRVLDASATDGAELQHSMSRAFNGGRNRLLLWEPAAARDVQFRNASDAFSPEMANGWALAVGAADLDGDLLPEIYVANDFGPDRLLHNRSRPGEPAFSLAEGRRGLTDPRSRVLGQDSFKGMGVDFGDVDRDGRLDIYVSNIAEDYALHESHFLFLRIGADEDFAHGVAPFVDASGRLGLARSGWAWDTKLADLNNDGRLEALQATGFLKGNADRWPELHELAMGNDELLKFPEAWPSFGPGADLSGDQHDRIYVADASGRFHDIASLVGVGDPTVSRGIAVADVDCDGDLDVAIAKQWSPSSSFSTI
jgi:enediyne biosynthesis protein E4